MRLPLLVLMQLLRLGGFTYGGTDNDDSSGNISYLQIVGTGAQINSESQ